MIRYVTSIPSDYHNDFDSYLYNQKAFLDLKAEKIQSFYAVNDATKTVAAQIHFSIRSHDHPESARAVSLAGSPFGSVEFSQHLEEEALAQFITFVKATLQHQGIGSIHIKECIEAYRLYGNAMVIRVLQEQQFVVDEVMPNHHMVVSDHPFDKKIHRMELRKLRKCIQAGFSFRQEPLEDIAYFYNLICACRQEKGWQLSMTLEEVEKSVAALPERYKIFSVYSHEKCVASCLAVLVNDRILYNFFPASLPQYNSYSPMVLLLAGLYQHCADQGIAILDLGTSPTASLQAFKIHVGGILSEKLSFYCKLP